MGLRKKLREAEQEKEIVEHSLSKMKEDKMQMKARFERLLENEQFKVK